MLSSRSTQFWTLFFPVSEEVGKSLDLFPKVDFKHVNSYSLLTFHTIIVLNAFLVFLLIFLILRYEEHETFVHALCLYVQ